MNVQFGIEEYEDRNNTSMLDVEKQVEVAGNDYEVTVNISFQYLLRHKLKLR